VCHHRPQVTPAIAAALRQEGVIGALEAAEQGVLAALVLPLACAFEEVTLDLAVQLAPAMPACWRWACSVDLSSLSYAAGGGTPVALFRLLAAAQFQLRSGTPAGRNRALSMCLALDKVVGCKLEANPALAASEAAAADPEAALSMTAVRSLALAQVFLLDELAADLPWTGADASWLPANSRKTLLVLTASLAGRLRLQPAHWLLVPLRNQAVALSQLLPAALEDFKWPEAAAARAALLAALAEECDMATAAAGTAATDAVAAAAAAGQFALALQGSLMRLSALVFLFVNTWDDTAEFGGGGGGGSRTLNPSSSPAPLKVLPRVHSLLRRCLDAPCFATLELQDLRLAETAALVALALASGLQRLCRGAAAGFRSAAMAQRATLRAVDADGQEAVAALADYLTWPPHLHQAVSSDAHLCAAWIRVRVRVRACGHAWMLQHVLLLP